MTENDIFNKLINTDKKDNPLYQCYLDVQANNTDIVDVFNTCVKDLVMLDNLPFDFKKLTEYAKELSLTRRDTKTVLCEKILSTLLGEKIKDICNNDRVQVITTPFKEFCPYPDAVLVLYTNSNKSISDNIFYDRYNYRVEGDRAVATPYCDGVRCYCLAR